MKSKTRKEMINIHIFFMDLCWGSLLLREHTEGRVVAGHSHHQVTKRDRFLGGGRRISRHPDKSCAAEGGARGLPPGFGWLCERGRRREVLSCGVACLGRAFEGKGCAALLQRAVGFGWRRGDTERGAAEKPWGWTASPDIINPRLRSSRLWFGTSQRT